MKLEEVQDDEKAKDDDKAKHRRVYLELALWSAAWDRSLHLRHAGGRKGPFLPLSGLLWWQLLMSR